MYSGEGVGGGGGKGHPGPEIREGAQSPKKFFGPVGPQFGLKIKGDPPGSPWIHHRYTCTLL